MMVNSGELSRNQANAEAWDMRDVPAFPETVEKVELPDAKAEMKFWSDEYNTAELQFAKYVKSGEFGNYRETLRKYEDDIRFDWAHLQDSTNKAWKSQLIRSEYELADAQRLGAIEPERTIEAATGIFYDERAKILNQEILNREQDEETKADHAVLRQTWRRVSDYIAAATDYEFKSRDYDAYHRMRQSCHNRMIQHLNDINRLAKKYGTERFTARDFMTNDFYYESKRDRGGNLNHRANYDRETVLAYFRTVFQKDFDSSEEKAKNKERGMLSGVAFYD